MCSKTEKEWHVKVYRKSETGWTSLQATNSNGRRISPRASVRDGSIVLPQIKSRIFLTSRENNSFLPIQRRRDTILVRGTIGSRAVALRFRGENECLEFSNLLLSLVLSDRLKENVEGGSAGSDKQHRASRGDAAEIDSYIAKLLSDSNFLDFTKGLEATISSSEDLKLMLEAASKTE